MRTTAVGRAGTDYNGRAAQRLPAADFRGYDAARVRSVSSQCPRNCIVLQVGVGPVGLRARASASSKILALEISLAAALKEDQASLDVTSFFEICPHIRGHGILTLHGLLQQAFSWRGSSVAF